MQENNFEKKIQQQMDGFRLRPSDAVWENVEREIRKKKRRRVILFFSLLAGLSLLGYTGYYFSTAEDKSTLTHAAPQDTTTATVINRRPPITPQSARANKSPDDRKILTDASNSPVDTHKIPAHDLYKKTKDHAGKLPANSVTKTNTDRPHKPAAKPLERNEIMPGQQQLAIAADDKKDIKSGDIHSTDTVVANHTESLATEKKEMIEPADSTATAAPVASKKTAHKIKWAIEVAGGISSNRGDAIFSSSPPRSQSYQSPSNGITSGFPTYSYPPSTVRNGPAFRIGASAERKISKRSSLSAGLRYAYMSDRIKVGDKTNNSFRFFNSLNSTIQLYGTYGGAQLYDHTNSYHFLQVPLAFHLQLNNSAKMPLTWDLNTSIGYLFTTNALIYDESRGGFYYKDNTAFNKLHFSIGTGISIGFKNRSGREWSIGPDISTDMTRQMKSAGLDSRYLIFGGIHAKWYLNKN